MGVLDSTARIRARILAEQGASGLVRADYRSTRAEGVSDFVVGQYFTSAESGALRMYKRIAAAPFYEDQGDAAAPMGKDFFLSAATLPAAKTANLSALLQGIDTVVLADRPGRWRRTNTVPVGDEIDRTAFVDGGGQCWEIEPTNGAIDIRSLGAQPGQDIAGIFKTAVSWAAKRIAAPFVATMIVIPPGTWYFDAPIVVTDVSVTVRAVGARIIKRHDTDHAFVATGTWTPVAVTSGSVSGSTSITVSSTAGITARSLLRIVSDDEVAGSYPQNANGAGFCYRGEVAVAAAPPTGQTVTLATPLRDTYSTNVRLGVYRDVQIDIEGGLWEGEEGHDDTWSKGIFKFQGALGLVSIRNLIVRRCYGSSAIKLYGLYQPQVTGVAFVGFSLSSTHDKYDYGIEDGNCTGLLASDLRAMGMLRHVYTTTASQVTANAAELAFYGLARSMNVGNVTAVGNFQAAIDAHHGSEDGLFHNWTITGTGSAGSAVGCRGRGHRISNVRASGCRYGLYVFTERGKITTAADIAARGTRDIIVENCSFTGCDYSALKVGDVRNLRIIGGRFESKTWRTWTFDTNTDAINSVVLEGRIVFAPGNRNYAGGNEGISSHAVEMYGSTTIENAGVVSFDLANANTDGAFGSLALIYRQSGQANSWIGFGRVETVNLALGVLSVFGGGDISCSVEDGEFVLPTGVRLGTGASTRTRRVRLRGRSQAATKKLASGTTEVFLDNSSSRAIIYSDPLTADQNIRLPTNDPCDGDTFEIYRLATCTGAFNINVRQGSPTVTTVKLIAAAGVSARFVYSGDLGTWVTI